MRKILLLMSTLYTIGLAQTPAMDSLWIPPESDKLLDILDHIYKLDFNSYEKEITAYRHKYPQRPEGIFVGAVALYLQGVTDMFNKAMYPVLLTRMDSVYAKLDSLYDESTEEMEPIVDYYLHATRGFSAIINVADGNWWAAAMDGRAAISGIRDALDGEIPITDAKMGTGLYLYYAEWAWERYPLVRPLLLFYPDGDRERGLQDIKTAMEEGIFSRVVAAHQYAQILYRNEDRYEDAFAIMSGLVDQYPKNPLFGMWYITMAYAAGKLDLAEEKVRFFERNIEKGTPYFYPYQRRLVAYRYGRILKRRGELNEANNYFQKAIQPLEPPMEEYTHFFKVRSMLQSAQCLHELGQLDSAYVMLENVLDLKEHRNSHEWAESLMAVIDSTRQANQR